MKKIFEHLRAEWYKYLLDILVIIVGIYGAFALDEWRDNRQEKKELFNYIQSIQKDIAADTTLLNHVNTILQKQIVSGKHILPILESDHPIIEDSLRFIVDFNEMTSVAILTKQKTTWDYINSSGVIAQINDPVLSELLQNYYREWNLNVENYNLSGVPARLEIRKLKYDLFEYKEHQKFFPANHPTVPAAKIYTAILSEKRILPLCRYIGGGSSQYYSQVFMHQKKQALSILSYLEKTYLE